MKIFIFKITEHKHTLADGENTKQPNKKKHLKSFSGFVYSAKDFSTKKRTFSYCFNSLKIQTKIRKKIITFMFGGKI